VQDGSRRRARLILIVGVALALVAGVGTFVYASGAKSDQPVAVPTVAVLVAAREIPAKTTLTSADVKLQEFNVDAKPAAAMTKADDALGKITIQSISVGEPILPTKFADPKNPSFVVMPASFIGPDGAPVANSPNFRAMSITVPDANAVGGSVLVGDLVDLMFTAQFDPQAKLQRHQNGHRCVSRPPRSQGDCDNEKSKRGNGPAENPTYAVAKCNFPSTR